MDANDPYFDPSDDDDDSSSDTSEGVVELAPDEIPEYFQERGADSSILMRQNGLNALLRRLIGNSSVGPVREVLAFAVGERRRVLDLGTGTGQWVLDMAHDFPHAKFYGVDIVPIATRYPPPNVKFEMHNIMDPLRYATGSIDMVHARSINMAIRDYPALIAEAGRVLRRGGLFVSCEWGRYPVMADGSDMTITAPRACAFFDAVRETLRMRRGIEDVVDRVPYYLHQSRQFTHITPQRFDAPIGDWPSDPTRKELGRLLRQMMEMYARSMRAVLLEGPWAAEAERLVQGYIGDLWSGREMVSMCYTVHARRV
ncbi:S-adenosyl-L-methionine-dependent methyltransferase [Trametes elegans]|nr:S-adenosyl-L-methionine-dependent methyltransferase [Trametes elegans]